MSVSGLDRLMHFCTCGLVTNAYFNLKVMRLVLLS